MIMVTTCIACEDDSPQCECNAYTIGSPQDYRKDAGNDKVSYCHDGKTISVSVNSKGHGNGHLAYTEGNDTGLDIECIIGECSTLGLDDLIYIPYSNDCNDNNKTVRLNNTPYVIVCEEFQ